MLKNKCYGALFEYHRKSQKMTLQNIAEKTGSSVSRLSKFENGIQFFKADEVIILFSILGLKIEHHQQTIQEVHEYMQYLWFNIIIKGNVDDDCYESMLIGLEQKNMTNETFFLIQFAKLFILVYQDRKKKDQLILKKQVEQYIEYIPKEYYAIIYDTFALLAEGKNNINEALRYYDIAYDEASSQLELAIIQYHRGSLLGYCSRKKEALKCIREARKIFQEKFYLYRSLLCSIQEGIIYFNANMYYRAISLFKDLLYMISNIHDEFSALKECILTNLLWSYFCAYQDVEILDNINLFKDIEHRFDYHVCVGVVYYRLKYNQKAKEHFFQATTINDENNSRLYLYMNAYKALLVDNYCQFKIHIEGAIKECEYVNDKQLLRYFYEEVIKIAGIYYELNDEIKYSRLLFNEMKCFFDEI